MLALLSFVLAVLTSPFKSKSRLEAENAALRHQLIILHAGTAQAHEQRSLVLGPALSMFPVDPAGRDDHAARDHRSVASGRLSLLLALEITSAGRTTADRGGSARPDPADEHRKPALGRTAHPRRTAQARV